MKLLLNHGGFNINIANNGLQAIEMVEQNPYDLIFMDKEMPQMDGYQTTVVLRENIKKEIIIVSDNLLSLMKIKCYDEQGF